jgi:hypothetical protein
MTIGQMAKWVNTLQHLCLEHFDIMVVVGKDVGVMRTKIANVGHV